LSPLLRSIQKTQCFVFCYDPVEKRPISVSTIDQDNVSAQVVLRQDVWNVVLCKRRHVPDITILWQVPWVIMAAAATSSAIWERLACIDVETSWILSSFLAILGRPVCPPSSKLSLTCAKCLYHLNAALQPKTCSYYACLIIGNVSLVGLPNFWQKLTFSC
jgi:hypothetical protein